MQKTALRYGLYGVYTLLVVFFLTWLILRNSEPNFETSEIIGWAGILLSVVFVYFGLKYYRDKQNGGKLSFGEGLKMGLLIVLFPSLAFGLFNVLYVTLLDTEYMNKYYDYQIQQLKVSVSGSELPVRLQEMEAQREMFSSPLVQFVVMFLSVFCVGLIVTVLSTLFLKRKDPGRISTAH